MKILCLDTETKTHNKGNPFDSRNKLIVVSWSSTYADKCATYYRDISNQTLQDLIDKADLIVGFNFKFDLHWFTNYGLKIPIGKVWDVQIAEFILSSQTNIFPSLQETCIKYGLPGKIDIVKTEYWDKGIDTEDIPPEILLPYAQQDTDATLECYFNQIKLMSFKQIRLCKLMCADLVILAEMERNGLVYDTNLCEERSKKISTETDQIIEKLSKIYPNIPINFNSGDHLSAFLYGGTVKETIKTQVGFYKTGLRKGEPKMANEEIEHHLPRLFEPIPGSELLKEGFYATNEPTLRSLKGKNRPILDLLLNLAKLEKLNGTYYKGFPKLNEKMNWTKGILHGQFNQTLAATGRLTASNPNQQNFAGDIQDIFISKYE